MMPLDDSDSFIIQRRNLVIISTIVLFFKAAELKPSSSVHLPLIDMDIGRPEAVEAFLHIMLVYFIWRYITAFLMSVGVKNTFNNFEENVRRKMQKMAFKKAETYLNKKNIKFERLSSGTDHNRQWEEPIKHGGNITKGASYIIEYTTSDECDPNFQYANIDHIFLVKGIRLQVLKAITLSKHFVFTNLFLEWYFPFLLAVVSLLECFNFQITHYLLPFFIW